MEQKPLPRPVDPSSMREFLGGYIQCMLWAETDESDPQGGEPLDLNYDAEDILPASRAAITSDCAEFVQSHLTDLTTAAESVGYSWARAGHDFWLSRNGHGAGYFDRSELTVELRDRLQDAARNAGERHVFVCDDGKLQVA